MKTWIIAALVVGMLVFATLGVVNFVKAESQSAKTATTQATTAPTCGAAGGGGCSASCNHASTGGSCGCGASCGCSGSGGCGCKAAK